MKSWNSLPFNRIPRTIRRKCVTGKISPNHWAHSGIPLYGNIKPERIIDGNRKPDDAWLACIWFLAIDEKTNPNAKFEQIKITQTRNNRAIEPSMGTWKRTLAAVMITIIWPNPIKIYGEIFPSIISIGLMGATKRLSKVPRSRSRVMAIEVIMIIVDERTTPRSPGTTLKADSFSSL